ncbi:MAG: transglycosylase domain-containing protein [Acidimicrobiales bacterium]|nr:transglycosylase domain-containing protein [Acidimicrobiales bacterium]
MRRIMKMLAATAVVAVLTPLTSVGVVLAAYLFLPLPAHLPDRAPPNASQISRVYDLAGTEIATFKQFETSIPVTKADIPEVLKQAVVAAEDRNFYSHGGVDVRGTLRALVADVRNRGLRQGGSTITQQLVKNTTQNGDEQSIQRKVREAILASQLDRSMEKDDILFEYLSVIYLGEGAYGAPAAAQTYFRKSVRDLTLSESALLAGVIPAPSRYSPRVDPATAEQRRLLVLDAMLEEDMIDQTIHDVAVTETVWLAANGAPPGPATVVYPPETQQSSDPYFTDYVYKWLIAHLPGGEDQIYEGGLRIETTLDPAQQAAAQAEVAEFLDGTSPDLRTSMVAVEPPTGYVRAFVSGRDFATDQVNYALGANSAGGVNGGGSGRQPGSAFKPFVLAEALGAGVTPEERYSGSTFVIDADNTIENYGGERYGSLDLRTATWKSVNTVYGRLILDVGVDKVMALAKQMGLTGVRDYDPKVHGASVALGVEDVSPLDMASAYGVFAARGLRAEPTPVLRVTDRDGNVLIDNSQPATNRVLPETVADNVTNILEGVLTSGTAAGRGLDRPAAGKTGTTQENVDAWFVGYTPTLSTAVWMGYQNADDGDPATFDKKYLTGIKGVRGVTGGTHPARIWQSFMRAALRNVPVTEFNEPAPIVAVADAAKVRARRGFEPGSRQLPAGIPGGADYVEEPPTPEADLPTTTTIEQPTTTTITGTTSPGGGTLLPP